MQLCHWVSSVSHDANASTKSNTWPHKSCYTSFQLSLLKKCSAAINNAVGITRCWCWSQWHHMTKNLFSDSFLCSWPNKWNGAMDNTVGIMWLRKQHQRHYMTEKDVAHCFRCFYLMNTVVLLTMTYMVMSVPSVIWLKICYISFWSTNAMVSLIMPSVSCDANFDIT